MKPLIQRDQKPWDKALMAVFLFLWCAWFVVMALDAARFRWSDVPLWLQVLGAIAIAVSMYIMHLIMRTNSFAAPVVKIQAERGHRVVSDGPYAIVRHPMYGGTLLLIARDSAAARIVVGLGACAGHHPAVRRPRGDGRAHADGGAAGLHGLRRAGALSAGSVHLVGRPRAKSA